MGRAKGGPQPAVSTGSTRVRQPAAKLEVRGPAEADLGAACRKLAMRFPPEYHMHVEEYPMAGGGFLGRQKWVQTIITITGPDLDEVTRIGEGIRRDIDRWNELYAEAD